MTDEEIALLVQQGDMESFGVLVGRYEAKMLRYARKFLFKNEDAEDNVQDVFIKAYRNIQSFDVKRKFSPWIYRIAHNQFLNALKRKEKDFIPLFNLDVLFPHYFLKESAEDEMNVKELKKMLDKILQKLKPKYREPLILYYFEMLDYKEIAEVLQIPTSTVGVRLRRGKEIMKEHIKKLEFSHA